MFLVLLWLFCITNTACAFNGSYAAEVFGLKNAKTVAEFLDNRILVCDDVLTEEEEYISLISSALKGNTDAFKDGLLACYLHESRTCSSWRIRAAIAGCIKGGANPHLALKGLTPLKVVKYEGLSKNVILAAINRKSNEAVS